MKYMLYFLVALRLAMISIPYAPDIFKLKKEMPEKAVAKIKLVLQKELESQELKTSLIASAAIFCNPKSTPFPYMDLFFYLWLVGVAGIVSCTVFRIRGFCREYVKPSYPVGDKDVLLLLEECKRGLGIQKKITARYSSLEIPVLCGIFRPKILLLENCRLSPAELRHVFLHELGHVKSYDILFNWLFVSVRILHWFNPLVFLMSRKVNENMELACDEVVLTHLGENEKINYGKTLVDMAERFSFGALSVTAVSIVNKENNLERRIKMIVDFKRKPLWASILMGMLFLGAGFGVLAEGTTKEELVKNLGGKILRIGVRVLENSECRFAQGSIVNEESVNVLKSVAAAEQIYAPVSWAVPECHKENGKTISYTPTYPEFENPTDMGIRFEITPKSCQVLRDGKMVNGIFFNCKAILSQYNNASDNIVTVDNSTSVFPVFIPLEKETASVSVPLKCFNKKYEVEFTASRKIE